MSEWSEWSKFSEEALNNIPNSAGVYKIRYPHVLPRVLNKDEDGILVIGKAIYRLCNINTKTIRETRNEKKNCEKDPKATTEELAKVIKKYKSKIKKLNQEIEKVQKI